MFTVEKLQDKGIFFSTTDLPGNQNGYIRLNSKLFIKLTVCHSSVSTEYRQTINDVIKVFVHTDKKQIRIGFDGNLVTRLLKSPFKLIEATVPFLAYELKGNYFSLIIVSKIPNSTKQDIQNPQKILSTDLRIADQFRYDSSPNIDGQRSKNEFLAGTGSNIGGRRGRR